MSIFAGALSDRFDKKKTMLICDLMAALMMFVLGVMGTVMCLVFGRRLKKYNYTD